MSEYTYLRLQDKDVLHYSENGTMIIDNENLLPFIIRGAVKNCTENGERSIQRTNDSAIVNFFTNRSLSVKKENAKYILNALNIPQSNDFDTKCKIMILCKGLSAADDYWITNNPDEKWKDVNLRENPLHETIAQISLYGKSLSITGEIRTPELTGQGAYAKAWERVDGKLFLYKAGNGHQESEIEVSVSNILDCTNVPHVQYDLEKKENIICCKCEAMNDDKYSRVDAMEVYSYCNRNGINFQDFVKSIDENLFYQTIIVDYLVSNRDRHLGNWGFYMDNNTGEIVGMHPLYDHNNAFDLKFMEDPMGGDCQLIENKKLKEAAAYAINHCDFRFIKDIKKEMFINDKHYLSFMDKASSLGLAHKIKPTFLQRIGFEKFSEYNISEIKANNVDRYWDALDNEHIKNLYSKERKPVKSQLDKIQIQQPTLQPF